jgi:methyl-accepting chemotaxis protein
MPEGQQHLMSMRSRVTAAVAACIALPMVAGWTALWLTTENTARNQVADDLKAQGQIVMDTISGEMREGLKHLQAWSRLPVMQEILINDEAGELAQLLVDLNRTYPEFASLTVTDARGLVIATTDPTLRKAQLNDTPGVQEAISGRTTQTGFARLQQDTAEAIRFTVPLTATYDRQTVIGTMVASMDIGTIATRAIRQSRMASRQRVLALARADTRQVIFANRRQDVVAAAAHAISLKTAAVPMDFSLGGEPGLASVTRSDAKALGRDPGLVVIAFEPMAGIHSILDNVSNIVVAAALLAAILALAMAWAWSTPLIRLAHDIHRLAAGDMDHRTQALAPYATFASLATAHETLRSRQQNSDRHICQDSRTLRMADDLKAHMTDIAELVDRINRENLATAASHKRSSSLDDLNHCALNLLKTIETIVESAMSGITADRQDTSDRPGDTIKKPEQQQSSRRWA